MNFAGSRVLRVTALALSLLFAGCASQGTLDSFYSLERTLAGVSQKSLQVGDHNWVYAEKGEGEPVLLLHGFAASKEVWMRMVADMPRGYRYIMPDLPGFGRSSYVPDANYDIPSQVPRLEAFASALGLSRFHLLGNSMGGNLAASYAATYPQRVVTLGLFAPSGVTQPNPIPSTLYQHQLQLNKTCHPHFANDSLHLQQLPHYHQQQPLPHLPNLQHDQQLSPHQHHQSLLHQHRRRCSL
jgi:pimeloyl-ACP methyl ester carboxylesterase